MAGFIRRFTYFPPLDVVTEIEGTKYVGGDGKWRSEKYAKETKLTVSRLIVRLGA